jgi:hypothetical protein
LFFFIKLAKVSSWQRPLHYHKSKDKQTKTWRLRNGCHKCRRNMKVMAWLCISVVVTQVYAWDKNYTDYTRVHMHAHANVKTK